MHTPSWNTLLPLITLALGYIGAGLQAERRDIRQGERETKQREAEVAAARETRQAEFQQKTLLALQDAVFRVMRTESQMYAHFKREHDRTGTPWPSIDIPDDLNEANRLARAEMNILVVRVQSDEVRQRVIAIRDAMGDHALMMDEQSAFAGLTRVWSFFDGTNECIGEEIRLNY
jgi:hypothetical protein